MSELKQRLKGKEFVVLRRKFAVNDHRNCSYFLVELHDISVLRYKFKE